MRLRGAGSALPDVYRFEDVSGYIDGELAPSKPPASVGSVAVCQGS